MRPVVGQPHVPTSGPGLRPTDHPLDRTDLIRILLMRTLGLQEGTGIIPDPVRPALVDPKDVVKFHCEIDLSHYELITHRDISRGLIADMHLVALLMQANEGAAHRDDIIIRMRRKNDDTLTGRVLPFRMTGHQLGGFAAGPSGDGVAHAIEDPDIDVVRVAVHHQQIAQAEIIVIVICEHQHRLVEAQGHIADRLADHLFRPVDLTGQPG